MPRRPRPQEIRLLSEWSAAERLAQADPEALDHLLREFARAADHRTMPTDSHALGRVQQAIRNAQSMARVVAGGAPV